MNGVGDAEDLRQHLVFIQAVIGRLASNSFLMKGWALTVSSAFFGFAAKDLNWRIGAVGLLPVFAFWFLDSYFLRQERLFRCLYEEARLGKVERFSMNISPLTADVTWRNTFFSVTLMPFYVTLVAAGLFLIGVTTAHDPASGKEPKDRSAPTSSRTTRSRTSTAGPILATKLAPPTAPTTAGSTAPKPP